MIVSARDGPASPGRRSEPSTRMLLALVRRLPPSSSARLTTSGSLSAWIFALIMNRTTVRRTQKPAAAAAHFRIRRQGICLGPLGGGGAPGVMPGSRRRGGGGATGGAAVPVDRPAAVLGGAVAAP